VLDGSVAYDQNSIEFAATDQGGIIRRLPRAVIQPASVEDIVRVVRYAHERRLPVAMRGRGHSAYGQTLVSGGIVIDSRTLDKVVSVSAHAVEVEAGASLGTLVRAAFDARSVVPVMSGCSMLSVGGWISVGGVGGESFKHGAFVDQVIELHVVTGDGRLIRCSDRQEPELFAMVLAGMGQCGIIARAKFRLHPAPEQITTRTITYDSLSPFLEDQARFVANDRLDLLWTAIRRGDDGSWRYDVTVGRRGAAREDTDPLTLIGDISRGRAAALVRRMYRDMVPARSAAPALRQQVAAAAASIGRTGGENPALCVYLPASAAREIMEPLLSSPSDSAGIFDIECVAFNANRFHRPLFRLPSEQRFFSCWALRTASAALARVCSISSK
jgi:cytokinin dehydrogenase